MQQPPSAGSMALPSAKNPPSRRRNSFLHPRTKWKGKRNNNRHTRKRNPSKQAPIRKVTWGNDQIQAYQPPRLQDLQFQNRLKASNYFPKRFTGRVNSNGPRAPGAPPNGSRAPGAPLNTTSYLMRARKSGGIATLVSPMPATPAVVPTPILSPLPLDRGLVDEANKEWGVNGYGSMNGLIRLRSSEFGKDDSESESDVEQGAHAQSVQQLEQRLDQDLSRFVMTYPASSSCNDGPNLLETRIDDQESHIAHLEEENVTLKERLYLMQHEVEDLRRRMLFLEGRDCDEQAEACSEKSTADVSYV